MSEPIPFDQLINEIERTASKDPFKPFCWYNKDGDAWEVFLEPGEYVNDRVDQFLTVRCDPKNHDRVLGLVFKNWTKNFPEELQKVVVEKGKTTLAAMIYGFMYKRAIQLSLKTETKVTPSPNAAKDRRIQALLFSPQVDETFTLDHCGAI